MAVATEHSKHVPIARGLVGGALLAAAVFSGCAQPIKNRAMLPDRYEFAREQLLFHSNVPLPAHHRLLAELTARRVDLSQELMLPISDEPIHVFVFEDAQEFNTFVWTHWPDLPRRRAFFLENDTRLEVYTQWGDRVAEDLRHEITHAYLHAVVPKLPLWLDEGLAENFELPRGCYGVNRPHVDLLIERLEQGTWQPDLRRLESLDDTTEMSQLDYAESWAWVHWLLATTPARKELLREYLRELHRNGWAHPLCERVGAMGNDPRQELVAHVRRVAASDR